jgi:Ca2+-binding RTX toxin-like protein
MLIDTLESRRLMSVTITSAFGTLNLEGTGVRDNVSVYHNPATNQFTVGEYNELTRQYTTRLVSGAGVTQIRVAGNGGDDTLSIDRNVKLTATIIGGDGNDFCMGGGGRNVLTGERGNDTLIGGDGNDYLWGMDGDDTLDGRRGSDVMYGMNGRDEVTYALFAPRTENLRLAPSGRAESGATGERDTIATDVEIVTGGNGNDLLLGTANNDFLRGGLGKDTLYGYGGDDFLHGDDGNDVLVGGSGRDLLLGGNGSDVLDARDGGFGDYVEGKWWYNAADGFDVTLIDRGANGAGDTVYRSDRVH